MKNVKVDCVLFYFCCYFFVLLFCCYLFELNAKHFSKFIETYAFPTEFLGILMHTIYLLEQFLFHVKKNNNKQSTTAKNTKAQCAYVCNLIDE